MKSCKNCGAQNPDSSLYCQDCGSRLGDWEPSEGASRMATPPTGLSRSGGGAASGEPACPRCGGRNASHMRFCNHCGYSLREPASREQPLDSPPPVAGAKGTVCWRCYGVGDPGADFCKFCGARYADAPSSAASEPGKAPPGKAPPVAAPPREEVRRPPADLPAPSSVPAPAASAAGRAALVSILKDGSDGRRYAIHDDHTDIGREEGQIVLTDDPYLSPRHARLSLRGGAAVLRDLDSVNGVYVRVREPVDLVSGDMFLLGQQVLRFEVLGEAELPLGPATQHGVMVFGTPEVQRVARLVQYTTEGVGRDVHYLYRDETVIGREQGDLVFTDDPFMSRRHAAVTIDRASRRYVLRDLGSSNGTAVRFRGERTLKAGDQFRVGRHLFRFEMEGGR
ncbi:MAG: FHA domain-containing protein [Sandaracinaceae bacterium]|nr:FHA domain-containing protein [Sandaracinaceae bacterium]